MKLPQARMAISTLGLENLPSGIAGKELLLVGFTDE